MKRRVYNYLKCTSGAFALTVVLFAFAVGVATAADFPIPTQPFPTGYSYSAGTIENGQDDAVTVLDEWSDIGWSIIEIVGMFVLGFGILDFGTSFSSHDESQRSRSIIAVVAGVLLLSMRYIISFIT